VRRFGFSSHFDERVNFTGSKRGKRHKSYVYAMTRVSLESVSENLQQRIRTSDCVSLAVVRKYCKRELGLLQIIISGLLLSKWTVSSIFIARRIAKCAPKIGHLVFLHFSSGRVRCKSLTGRWELATEIRIQMTPIQRTTGKLSYRTSEVHFTGSNRGTKCKSYDHAMTRASSESVSENLQQRIRTGDCVSLAVVGKYRTASIFGGTLIEQLPQIYSQCTVAVSLNQLYSCMEISG
jgi:hypothetical protein